MDVYCGVSPRPGPSAADHSWWMVAGEGGGTRCKVVKIPPHPISSDYAVSEDDRIAQEYSSDRSLSDAIDDTVPPSELGHGGTNSSIQGEDEKGRGGRRRESIGAGGPAAYKGMCFVHPTARTPTTCSPLKTPTVSTVSLCTCDAQRSVE